MKIYMGADHGGITLAKEIGEKLQEEGYNIEFSKIETTSEDDYPDFAFDVCEKVLKNDSIGILFCGTGIGISIAANKVKGIRCARITNENDAYYAKNHNRANVIAMGKMETKEALKIVTTFLNAPIDESERHQRRIEKIIKYEKEA